MALPRNSVRSGGPSTSRGIALISQNSLKTGVYSAQAILPGEDEDSFEVLSQDLMADFRPSNRLEQSLVQDVAVLMWKKQRIESLEQRAPEEAFQKLADKLPLDANFDGAPYPVALPMYMWDGLKLTTQQVAGFREVIPQIDKLMAKRSGGRCDHVVPPDSALFVQLHAMAGEIGLTADQLLSQGRIRSSALYPVLHDILVRLLERAQSYLCIASNKAVLGQALMSGWTSAMTTVFYADKSRRAAEDNNRALYRTLAELRKLQTWRQYVDVRDLEDLKGIKDV